MVILYLIFKCSSVHVKADTYIILKILHMYNALIMIKWVVSFMDDSMMKCKISKKFPTSSEKPLFVLGRI